MGLKKGCLLFSGKDRFSGKIWKKDNNKERRKSPRDNVMWNQPLTSRLLRRVDTNTLPMAQSASVMLWEPSNRNRTSAGLGHEMAARDTRTHRVEVRRVAMGLYGTLSLWYNRTGWLGLKHQFTYLLTYLPTYLPAKLRQGAGSVLDLCFLSLFTDVFLSLLFVFSTGDTCSLGGTCDQTYRIHWVLVTTPSGDTFVPTSVPSHCTCVYS